MALRSFAPEDDFSQGSISLTLGPPAQRIYRPDRGGQSLSESFTPPAVF